jgi:hypothetical protein
MREHPICAVCRAAATAHLHHIAGRIGERLNDQVYWLPVCLACHTRIHAHGAWAREQGYLI